MKITFPTRENLADFLNAVLPNMKGEFDFEIDGKTIIVKNIGFADELKAQAAACIFEGVIGEVDLPKDHVVQDDPPIGEILTDPIASQEVKDAEYHQKWPELWPYLEELERAAEHLAHVRRGLKPWMPANEVEAQVSRAKAVLGTAARRYTRALDDKLNSVRFR